MSIILNVNDLLDAAGDILPSAISDPLIANLETATEALALALAEQEGVTHSSTDYEPGFGGLCAVFKPGHSGKVSPALAKYDEGGEWNSPPLTMDRWAGEAHEDERDFEGGFW